MADVLTFPDLNDVPKMLRRLAERVEAGEFGEVPSLIVVMPQERSYPRTFGFGAVDDAFDPIVQLFLAHEWHVKACAGFKVD